MDKTILFVDDEIQILRSLKRVFWNSGYNLLTAQSAEEALKVFTIAQIDLILTDITIPGMDGLQLLKEVKDKYPSTIRMVLSGNVESSTLIKIQKNCLAKLYLLKPWKNEELIRIIERVFELEELLKNKNILELINEIDFLPAARNSFHRLNQLIEQDADMGEIASAIEHVPSVAAKVLQIANSAFYGIITGSVKKAILYLGLFNVKNVILCTSLYQGLEGVNNAYLQRDLNTLWLHSVMTHKILSFLYERLLGKKIPDTCAMAGLLHDVGKIVLLSKYTDEYLKATKALNPNTDTFYYYEEMEFLEVTHPEIGGYLLNWWELPYPIVEAVLFHHSPLHEKVMDKELVSLLNIADICSWNIIAKQVLREIDGEVLQLFNISQGDLESLVKEINFAQILHTY